VSDACPFCSLEGRDPVWSNDLAVAFRDGYPVSEGHTLIVTKRHVTDYFDASPWERQALWEGVAAVKAELDESLEPGMTIYQSGLTHGSPRNNPVRRGF
jgi:diadenosine tetraphosphate (Ap4A) HIT family hydrolase